MRVLDLKNKQPPALLLKIRVESGQLVFELENLAGPRHHIALEMQAKHGASMVFDKALELGSIGNSTSTLLGMGEIRIAADAMGATYNLRPPSK